MDWGKVFGLSVPLAELLVRGSVMFFFLFALFRVVIKRRVGAISMADLLVLVIIADAAQNGMAGEYTSVTDLAEVEKALIEPDGQVTVISRRGRGASPR